MNRQKEAWSGEFGDAYHQRNRVDWRKRILFWREILDITGVRSVYELGCGPGWNLSAIEAASRNVTGYADDRGWKVVVSGEDLNEDALDQAHCCGLDVRHSESKMFMMDDPRELVFTAGMLIHVPPEELQETMQRVIDLSCDYVMSIEYEDDTEVEVEYRGQKGLLWRRPYGKLYEGMGLKPVLTGVAGGFSDCQFWLLRK